MSVERNNLLASLFSLEVSPPKKNGNYISDLISELFKNIDSKESFNFVTDLVISALNIYKRKFVAEQNNLGLINNEPPISLMSKHSNSETEYLSISNDIHSILSNCPELNHAQKLEYCNSQRYFMKMYLKEIIVKLNLH